MFAQFDDIFIADLDLARGDRALSDHAVLRLARSVAGFGAGRNRDRPAHDLAATLVFFLRRARAGSEDGMDQVLALLLDPRSGTPGALRAMEPDVAEAAPQMQPGPLRMADACTFGAFLALCECGDGFGEFRAVIRDLCGDDTDAGFAIARRRIAALADRYRRRHVLGLRTDQRSAALHRFLARHGAEPREELAIRLFCELVEQGERPLFSAVTTALLAELEARIETDVRARVGEAATGDEAAFDGPDDRFEEHGGVDPVDLVDLLASLPASPKFLTQAERDRALDVLRFAPWHRRLPLTCLRAITLSRWQMMCVNRLKRSQGKADVTDLVSGECAPRFGEALAAVAATIERIDALASMHIALNPPEGLPPDRVARAAERGRLLLRAERRSGFDVPRDVLAPMFAAAAPALATIGDELRAFMSAAAKAGLADASGEQERHDREVFSRLFTRLYVASGGQVP